MKTILIGVGLLAALGAAASAEEKADRIFVNGRIWTGDDARPSVEALAVRETRILALGTSEEMRKRAETGTEIVDLKGRFMAPGFDDAHLHFMSGSLDLDALSLDDARTVEELQWRIGAWAKANPDRPWVAGRGWVYSAFAGGLPHKTLLDTVVADRPAWMTSYDGHAGWANSAALRKAEVHRGTADPPGGAIVRDERGEPTGVLKDTAMALVAAHVPPPVPEEKYRALRKGIDRAASFGLTSVQNAGFDEEDFRVYEEVLGEGRLKLRVSFALSFEKNLGPDALARYRELKGKHASEHIRIATVKGFVDGVVEARTAAMFEPYAGGGGSGLPRWTQEDLDRTAALYDREGFQIQLHAIGDRAVSMALDAFEHAARANGPLVRRHRIEHLEVPRLADLARFKALGVVASTQAFFARPDENHNQVYLPALGPERAARAMPFKAIDDAGVVQAFGSDWPVYPCEVLKGIYCAVTRMTPQGTPAGGWEPAQRISVEAALRHFTRDAAYASQEEAIKGTLTPGKLADLVVLSENILAVPPERILRTKVLLTVRGGQDTYRAQEFR